MIVGNKEAKMDIQTRFSENPITLSGKPMKNSEKYLGDYISASGTAD